MTASDIIKPAISRQGNKKSPKWLNKICSGVAIYKRCSHIFRLKFQEKFGSTWTRGHSNYRKSGGVRTDFLLLIAHGGRNFGAGTSNWNLLIMLFHFIEKTSFWVPLSLLFTWIRTMFWNKIICPVAFTLVIKNVSLRQWFWKFWSLLFKNQKSKDQKSKI